MKYDGQLSEVAKFLPSASNILILLPADVEVDGLAAGLSLFLSLEQSSKETAIVTEGVIKVGHTHLFGVGQIRNKLPEVSGGDFILTLGGVATADGKVPAVEKMDYFPQGTDLNLVFRVLPGQTFNPTHITPKVEGGGFNLIFTIGVNSLESLGTLYTNNQKVFSESHIVNIDIKQENSQFGKTNIVDTSTSSLSEIMGQILPGLALPVDQDIATNILAGIFTATSNLQGNNVGADTYEVIAAAMRAGGKKPEINKTSEAASAPALDNPVNTTGSVTASTTPPAQSIDLNKIFNTDINTGSDNFTVPPVVNEQVDTQNTASADQPSAEEAPMGEGVSNSKPEADWLTPKIYKGSSIG